ncbi:thioredoxin [Saccharicrinis sp. FJH54]|uniref:thioredoxin n=1 Tax=Saccharicrinis sp. FJH54 TaxID=3344665 RepID=UPI0035D48D25
MGWYIGLGVLALVIAYIAYSYRKMKNVEDVAPSKDIRILDNKNFKPVIKSGKVLVDFWAPWCAPCKMVAPTLNEIAEEQKGNITIAKVNVDKQQALAQKYNIRNIPTMILFDNGKEVKRIMGVKPKRSILKEVGLA